MRDDDRLLDLPEAEFGSGVVGVCDICGVRQAVIVLTKERFRLCVLDFLNKSWLKTEKKPSAPVPLYRTERVTFETGARGGTPAPALAFSPTKVIRRPGILIAPDVYGITTTVLDAAIRFAREGFEVLVPDLGKTEGIGASTHLAMRSGTVARGGVPVRSARVRSILRLYGDALRALAARELVDPARLGVFGSSYGGSLALALSAEETRLRAVALAYPMPVAPATLPGLVTAPVLVALGTRDRAARLASEQIVRALPSATVVSFDGARHHFLSRDLRGYDLLRSEEAWASIVQFLKDRLVPPAPRPPAAPVKFPAPPATPAAAPTAPAPAPSPAA